MPCKKNDTNDTSLTFIGNDTFDLRSKGMVFREEQLAHMETRAYNLHDDTNFDMSNKFYDTYDTVEF